MLNELSRNIRFDNASKGFDPTEGGVNRYILLTISELCEAQNELRDGHPAQHIYYSVQCGPVNNGLQKPEGFPIEVADAAIRLLDIAGKFEFDLDSTNIIPVDYGVRATLDDWLLGLVDMISDMFNSAPGEYDFQYGLQQALSTMRLMCEREGIDLDECIEMKLAFNRTRPPKHGRQF